MASDKEENSVFFKKVIKLILAIPKGKVASYGQIADLAGKTHSARVVSWILHSSTRKYNLPWHRVVNSRQSISFPKDSAKYTRQRNKLEKEGIEFSRSGKIDFKKYQWKKRK